MTHAAAPTEIAVPRRGDSAPAVPAPLMTRWRDLVSATVAADAIAAEDASDLLAYVGDAPNHILLRAGIADLARYHQRSSHCGELIPQRVAFLRDVITDALRVGVGGACGTSPAAAHPAAALTPAQLARTARLKAHAGDFECMADALRQVLRANLGDQAARARADSKIGRLLCIELARAEVATVLGVIADDSADAATHELVHDVLRGAFGSFVLWGLPPLVELRAHKGYGVDVRALLALAADRIDGALPASAAAGGAR